MSRINLNRLPPGKQYIGNPHFDLTGQRFGKLLVLHYIARVGPAHHYWQCLCDCGNPAVVNSNGLRNRGTYSCGCAVQKHGMSGEPEFYVWQQMKDRCSNPNAPSFHDYGERGIRVCTRWFNSFTDFLSDMGRRTTPRHSIERKDNNGNYSCGKCEECAANHWPTNCKWATWDEQANNRRSSHLITAFGKTMTRTRWAKETGISVTAIYGRMKSGWWTAEQALSIPSNTWGPKIVMPYNHKRRP